ncbi:hypothetical protein KC336_g10346 [Hortaea werneckii]|nr:hypothetical protein KC336_g10346 [Hortaea werneckii]
MVNLMGTITAVSTVTAGLFALCATITATPQWSTPACLATGFASGVDLILGIVQDATGSTKTSGNNPDEKRAAPQWHRILPDGGLKNFDQRLPELHGTNETVDLIDLLRGYSHKVWMEGEHLAVKTNFAGLTTSTSEKAKVRRGHLSKRLTDKQRANELTEATYMAQKVGSATGGDTQANADVIGRDIADNAYQLGTYCSSILDGQRVVADIGLTLGGPEFHPSPEPPCEANTRKRL